MENYNELIRLALEWNEKINITAITDPKEFLQKNILDSLAITGEPAIENAKKILDLGTGGGYPGLPLAMHYPDKEFVLMDSVNKKLKVIDDIAKKLNLKNVTTVHGRAEDLAREKEYRDAFDLVVSRAVASMPTLVEYSLPFVKRGGYFVAYKTTAAMDEIVSANPAITRLGGRLAKIQNAGTGTDHVLVVVEKLVETPGVFPRKAGEAKRNPII